MAGIRITPEVLDKQGKELIGFAGNLEEVLKLIDGKITEIIDGWDGLGQDAYYDMYTTMKQNLENFPKLVDSLGQAAVKTAEAFSNLDTTLQSGFIKSGA